MFGEYFVLLILPTTGTWALSVSSTTATLSVDENKGADLDCRYTDILGNPRVEWKFKDLQGSQVYVVYDNQPTADYKDRVEVYRNGLRFNTVTRKDNGEYTCAVSSSGKYGDVRMNLIVKVPPSVPICGIPSSSTTGTQVTLTCHDVDGSPPSTYKWYKNNIPLPEDPSKFPDFANSSYTLNPSDGTLKLSHNPVFEIETPDGDKFTPVSKMDSADYHCVADNGVGLSQSCASVRMAVYDVNTGGIVAGVIILLLVLALLGFGLWFAHRKGYLSRTSERKPQAAYSQPPSDEDDGEFRQKSSFVV